MNVVRFTLRVLAVGLGLVLLPKQVDSSGITPSTLCAAEPEDETCYVEIGSFCDADGVPRIDRAPREPE